MNQLERKIEKFQVKTFTKTSQTDQHPEIPYKVTRLDTIKWCKPEEYMVDDMDEYLNDQYEQELKDYYTEAREEARARKIKTESSQTWWIYLNVEKIKNISS